jgi:hypothetical protein
MSDASTTESARRPQPRITLRGLHDELRRLRQRVEDLEDLRDLNDAIARNKDKRLIPWDEAKKSLGLDS